MNVRIPIGRRISMVLSWAKEKVEAQFRAVVFISAYLAVFQILILRAPIQDFFKVAAGTIAVIVGLAFFMEGLFLGIMPLGERCGLRLPGRAGFTALAGFSVVLGLTATYAEPAIAFLKVQGGATTPWSAPMLYLLLNRGSSWLVAVVALGVGIAVVLGVFRFLFGWSLKPFLFIMFPVLLVLSWLVYRDPRISAVMGLAWDAGGVTTGPVTVPLVISLGVGVSRMTGKEEDGAGGLGVVTLASALPVGAVLILALGLAPAAPLPMDASGFFSRANQKAALFIVGTEARLRELALEKLEASDFARAFPVELDTQAGSPSTDASDTVAIQARVPRPLVLRAALDAVKAIMPLSLVLLFALLVVIREKLPQPDQIFLGLSFSLIGLFLFGLGMESGLGSLGRQSGTSLPRAFESTERPDKAVLYTGLDEYLVLRTVRSDGGIGEYLAIDSPSGPEFIPFNRDRYDAGRKSYLLVPKDDAIAGDNRVWGYLLVLLFVFIMGLGATMAEPSLNALGVTLEELTTGTYRRSFLVTTVGVGVGIGMVVGFVRILFDVSLLPLLAGSYSLALVMSIFSSEEISSIAWDSAGVTTGPITVPLVIAAGLGIGERTGNSDVFGILACASVFPIIAVLASGLYIRARRGKAFEPGGHET